MRSLRFFMLMAVVICSLAVNAQDAIANDDSSTATSTVLESYGTDVKSENFTLLQHNDTLVSDAELLKSIAKDTSAKRLKKARIFKWTAWVGGSVFFLASVYCLYGAAFVAYFSENGPGVNPFAIGAAASFGASVIWTTSFLIAAHHQKKLALSANVSMLNDDLTNRKTLGVGLSFKF
ncbi:hypothetical protein [Leyella stercorea]|uniref:hypothetical protein n=1 Tax=Leyella stercorea TaxID=363265 RepID=UPI00242D8B01|nr:hypothetical protein [Leyella stercorea]